MSKPETMSTPLSGSDIDELENIELLFFAY